MIRVSRADGAALLGKQTPRTRRRKEDLPENVLERQVCDFLKAHGWTLTRNHVGLFVPYRESRKADGAWPVVHPIHIGETGMADWRAERAVISTGLCEVFYFETKAPGKFPTLPQRAWLENKRALGFEAEYFNSSESFMSWYGKT